MLNNIYIREMLFGVVALLLFIKLLIVIRDNISLQRKVENTEDVSFNNFVNTYFSRFDKVLALFLLINILWIFIIPIFTGTPMKSSIKETLCVNLLFLYFPIVILMKLNLFNWEKYKIIIKSSILILALIHIIFYIGEIIVGDCSFVLNIFKGIQKLTNGHTIRPLVMMPDSYIRIIYPASILLIITFYFTIKSKQNIKDMIFTFGGVFALFTTVTKSLFFGVIGGFIAYYIIIVYKKIKTKEKLQILKVCKFISIILVSCIILNYTIFDNYVFMRLKNPLIIATDESQKQAQNIIDSNIENKEAIDDVKERAGTERANLTRIIQIQKLLDAWKQKPLLGWGYGSSAEEYLRSDAETPYAYEMVGVALLMKIGIIGILMWLSFLGYLIWHISRKLAAKTYDILPVIYVIIALGISTQFNPFLFTTSGMGILLFCFIEMKKVELI